MEVAIACTLTAEDPLTIGGLPIPQFELEVEALHVSSHSLSLLFGTLVNVPQEQLKKAGFEATVESSDSILQLHVLLPGRSIGRFRTSLSQLVAALFSSSPHWHTSATGQSLLEHPPPNVQPRND